MEYLKQIYNWLITAKPDWAYRHYKPDDATKKLLIDIIEEEVNELKHAKSSEDILDAVIDIIWVAMNSIPGNKISFNEFEEYADKVLESNNSKFCETEEDAIETVYMYKTGMHPDKMGINIETYYQKIGDVFVIFRSADNKILKSYKYKKVIDI